MILRLFSLEFQGHFLSKRDTNILLGDKKTIKRGYISLIDILKKVCFLYIIYNKRDDGTPKEVLEQGVFADFH
jgi:hypothetical protein